MTHDIRLWKLINGDMVIGKFASDSNTIKDAAILQTVPSQQGVQMMLLPFGYPFDTEIDAEIDMKHVIYEYKKCPDELQTKYLEASSNITMATGNDLSRLQNLSGGGPGAGSGNISDLFKK